MKSFPRALAAALPACYLAVFPLYVAATEADAVVVTATRTAQLADQVLAPVIVITREKIERSQAADVADLLRFHAGLDLGRNGGPGQATSLFLRGTNSDHTLVMLDGVRINPATIGGAALHNIDPALVERIEIVKGPRSSLYGSEAIGGVINIITRRAAQGVAAEVSAGGGSYDTRKLTANLRHGRDSARFGIDISRQETDGYPPRTVSDVDRGHDNTSLNAHVGYRVGEVDVELSHFEARGNTEYLDSFTVPPELDQDFRNAATALTLAATPTAMWATRLQVSQVRDEIDQNQGADFAHTDRRMLDWQNDLQVGSNRLLTAGVWLMREEVTAAVFGSGFDEDTDTRAVYLQDSAEFGAHSLLAAARYTDHDAFGGHLTWDAGYGYRLSEATRLTAAAGTAFRAPDSTDRFGFGGNPDLEPEESRQVELGLRHRLSPAQRVSLNLFRNEIDNLIEFDFITTNQMVNLGKARIRGVEAAWNYSAAGWYAGVEAIVQDPESRASGQALPRRAKRSMTAAFGYDSGRYQLGLDVLASAERRDSDFSDVRLPGYGLANLHAAVWLTPQWVVRARVENLFDKDYALADGFNTADRSWFLQLGWRHVPAGGRS